MLNGWVSEMERRGKVINHRFLTRAKKQQKKSEIISSKCAESRDIKNNYDNEFTQKNETAITEKFFLRKQNCKMYQILKFSNLKK